MPFYVLKRQIFKIKILKKILFIISLILANIITLKAQCEIANQTFVKNEYLKYQVYYNWGVIWVKAGQVVFNVKDTTINKVSLWKFTSIGKSQSSYDWFFKVRDNFESIVYKETLKPIYHHSKTLEGNDISDNEYIFSKKKQKIFCSSYNSNKSTKITKDTFAYDNCIFDVLSATYFTRSLDFSNTKLNDSIPIKTIIDGEKIKIYVKYLGEEEITHINEKKYKTIKFSTSVAEGSVFKANQKIYVWVSNDKNRIPILIKADILVGSVKVYLLETKNMKFTSNY